MNSLAGSGGTITYHHPDHLSNRLDTNSSGASLGTLGHLPFGDDWYGSSGKWKFTSYERDSESNLDYAINRYHSSAIGRFASPDLHAGSIYDPQSLNRYAYTRNDPVNLSDPLGLNFVNAIGKWFSDHFGGDEGSGTGGLTATISDGMLTKNSGDVNNDDGGGRGNDSNNNSRIKCLPNVRDFVNAHLADAQAIANQLGHGVTAQEILATSANETTYGSQRSLAPNGNFFGLHGKGFPGETGTYTTKGNQGKGQTVTPIFPQASGFALSGQVFVSTESKFLSKVDSTDPNVFFQTIHEHGYGTTTPDYVGKVMADVPGNHGAYALVGACLPSKKGY